MVTCCHEAATNSAIDALAWCPCGPLEGTNPEAATLNNSRRLKDQLTGCLLVAVDGKEGIDKRARKRAKLCRAISKLPMCGHPVEVQCVKERQQSGASGLNGGIGAM